MRDFPTEQMAFFDVEKGDALKAKADRWIISNPEAWMFIKHEAACRAEEGKRFGIGELCEQVRWHMKAQGVDAFKLNNDIRAPLARKLIAELPHIAPFIQTRSSVVDL